MACPYRCDVNNNDGSASCSLCGSSIDNETQQKYCISHYREYEHCAYIEDSELLTESVCEEILRSFEASVQDTCEGLAAFVELITDAALRFDYLPLQDACRILEDPPEIPQANGLYTGIVKTSQERELAQRLDKDLDSMLDTLHISVRFGSGGGEYPVVSPGEIDDLAGRLDNYGSLAADCMERFQVSVKPDIYAEPVEELASEAGVALRHWLLDVVEAVEQAGRDLESGMQRCISAAGSGSGWVLQDAGIKWDVD